MYRNPVITFAICCSVINLMFAETECAVGQSNVYRPTVEEIHPDFELPSIDENKLVKLSDFRGKKLLLFHFASW